MARALGGRRHLPLRPHEDPRRGVLHRHAAADGERLAAHRARDVVLAHRPHRPLPAHARQGGLLPDGVGRQRPQRGAPRPAAHRHDRRPHPPLRPRLPAPREGRPEGPRHPGQPAELHRAVRGGRARSSRRSTTSSGPPSGCRSTGTTPTRRSAPRPPARRSAGSCASSRATSPTAASRRRCGTSTCARRWPRPSSTTASSPGRTTSSCSPAPTARCLIDTTRPELLAACVAVVAHPDDERYQPLFGQHGRHAAVRRRPSRSSPTSWPTRRRAPASR